MLAVHAERRVFRVLGLLPNSRHTGHVVLDDHGLVPESARCAETRRYRTHGARIASITRLVEASVRRHEVSLVALVRPRDAGTHPALVSDLVSAISTLGVSIETLDEQTLVDTFRVADVSGFDHLGQAIARGFFPELARSVPSWRRGHEQQRRRVRPLWKATAAALLALAKLHPDAVASLSRGPMPPGLASLVHLASHPAL